MGKNTKEALLDKDVELIDADASNSSSSSTAVSDTNKVSEERKSRLLLISFFSMLIVGVANRVLSVLQYAPMQNYPLFVNMLTTFMYIPVSLVWVIPIVYGIPGVLQAKGWVSMESDKVPQYKWAIMGFLDSTAGILQAIAIDKISNGSLVVLLLQFAIPSSMIITRIFLKTKYTIPQYVGATIVTVGILIVLIPTLTGGGGSVSIGWSLMLMGSCIPMCLSSVYKEKALGDVELDPIWFNLMVAVYQFIFSFPLLPPSAVSVELPMNQIFSNLWDGMKCYVGINTLSSDSCGSAPAFVNLYILANVAYNILIILILKYGSSNILWLSMTATVPISDLVFAIPGIPQYQAVTWSIGAGLPIIMSGLIIYRFYAQVITWSRKYLGYKEVSTTEFTGDNDDDERNPSV